MDDYSKYLVCPTIYQICVGELLREAWSAWLSDMLISLKPTIDRTVIIVAVPDQAALRGILNRLWDSNLTLISVSLVQEDHNA